MSSDRVPIFIWQIYFPVPVPGKFPAKRFDDASACKHARFPARSLARLKRRNSRGEILEGNSSAYLPGRHRAPPGASSTPLPSTGTSSSWRSLCRMIRARALLTASQNVSHSPKDLPKVNLSRHIFLVPREKSHRTHRDTVTRYRECAREVTTRPFSSRTHALADAMVPRPSLWNTSGKSARSRRGRSLAGVRLAQ